MAGTYLLPTVSAQLERVSRLRWLTAAPPKKEKAGTNREGTNNGCPTLQVPTVGAGSLPQVLVGSSLSLFFHQQQLWAYKGPTIITVTVPGRITEAIRTYSAVARRKKKCERRTETAGSPLISSTVADIDMVVIHVSPQQQQLQLRLASSVTNMTTFWLPSQNSGIANLAPQGMAPRLLVPSKHGRQRGDGIVLQICRRTGNYPLPLTKAPLVCRPLLHATRRAFLW